MDTLQHGPVGQVRRSFSRVPRHVGVIPDGNRRWAEARGLPRRDGYAAGIPPRLALLRLCRELGIQEVSIYGFTRENARRPADQVKAFGVPCAKLGLQAVKEGAALQAIGDAASKCFPDIIDTLWPDMRTDEFIAALRWYEQQDVTLGG